MSVHVEVAQVEQRGLALVGEAKALVIHDGGDYQRAGTMLRMVKDYLRKVADLCEPVVAAALAAHRAAVAQRTKLETPAKEAEGILKRAMVGYMEEMDRQQREAQHQAEAKAEAARQLLLAAEEERQVMAAMEAEASGHEERATAILTAPVVLPPVLTPPVVLPPKPTAAGVSFREDWDFEVVEAGMVPREYLSVDLVKIRGVVRAMKGATTIPGIRVFSKKVVASK